jgi:DNA-binding NarL/FixJ family response regulator
MPSSISRPHPAREAGRESVVGIARLGRMSIRVQLARIHLLYGEWLRRERRRLDARERLHTAFEMFNAMGLEAFTALAERLTAQEAQVARLARDGLSNTEIGERGVHHPAHRRLSPPQVFSKLSITSRNQLARVLPDGAETMQVA